MPKPKVARKKTALPLAPRLRAIELEPGECENKRITSKGRYLVKIFGDYAAGKFSRQWYGWNFDNWGTSGVQLDQIDAVFEILPPRKRG